MLVARRFVFFDFNLKAKALILAALELRWPCVRGNEKWRKRFFVYQISDSLTQIIQDYPRRLNNPSHLKGQGRHHGYMHYNFCRIHVWSLDEVIALLE